MECFSALDKAVNMIIVIKLPAYLLIASIVKSISVVLKDMAIYLAAVGGTGL